MSRSYVTAARLTELADGLSVRDWALVRDVARCTVMSGGQLRALHYADTESGKRLARMDLARLAEARVLGRLSRRVGGVRSGSEGYVYALDVAGQRLVHGDLDRYRPPWTPGTQHLAHALTVSQLYTDLTLGSTAAVRLSEFDGEPACWRTFTGSGGSRLILKPDAWVAIENGEFEDQAFIEVDRSTESLTRILDKARLYIRYWQTGTEQHESGMFPIVAWLVPDQRRADQIRDVLTRLPEANQEIFTVGLQGSAAHHLLTGSLTAQHLKGGDP